MTFAQRAAYDTQHMSLLLSVLYGFRSNVVARYVMCRCDVCSLNIYVRKTYAECSNNKNINA